MPSMNKEFIHIYIYIGLYHLFSLKNAGPASQAFLGRLLRMVCSYFKCGSWGVFRGQTIKLMKTVIHRQKIKALLIKKEKKKH